jgi:hypothetical protein
LGAYSGSIVVSPVWQSEVVNKVFKLVGFDCIAAPLHEARTSIFSEDGKQTGNALRQFQDMNRYVILQITSISSTA